MSFRIIRDDITKIRCDAIVNAANNTLLGGGGVDGAIHRAAGKELLEECISLHGCITGEAKLTLGYRLPCKYIIHTVGPVWRGGNEDEEQLLRSCYMNSLKLAVDKNCKSIAFPLISSGAYGYPKDKALNVAVDCFSSFLDQYDDLEIILVVYDKASFCISKKLVSEITEYIGENYIESIDPYYSETENIRRSLMFQNDTEKPESDDLNLPKKNSFPFQKEQFLLQSIRRKKNGSHRLKKDTLLTRGDSSVCSEIPQWTEPKKETEEKNLKQMLESIDESFSEMLLRKIDEKGMTDSQCYKKANIDRKLFSKIRSDKNYKPKKETAIAFILALELPLDEARDMLMKAGFALSHSNKFDIIIEYFIKNNQYDVFIINETLFAFDQKLICS